MYMAKRPAYILLCLAVLVCLLPSCRRAKIMSVQDMSDIYAEMFLADQWLGDNYSARRSADTTRFYETIFHKFGYDFEDYDASVNYYLHHPEKYRKIMELATKKLRTTATALELFEKKVEKQRDILSGLASYHIPEFRPDSICVDTAMVWAPWRDSVLMLPPRI